MGSRFVATAGRCAIVALLAGAAPFVPAPAVAQTPEEFYKGRAIDLVIGASVGGGYDIAGRMAARFWGNHIPGNPTLVPRNVPGGASLNVANLIYNVEKRDGSAIGMIVRNVITMPLMGIEAVKFDIARMNWLGSITDEASLCISRHDAPVKSWQELLQRELIVGVSSPGSDTYTNPVMLRNIFGARFKIVGGYPDAKQIEVALERHEVDASCGSWSSLKAEKPDWVRNGLVNYLVLISDRPKPDLPGVPTIFELAKSEEIRTLLRIILAPQVAGRPFIAPPDIPEDRRQALRRSFDATMEDARFAKEAERVGIDVSPTTGEEIAALVQRIYASPPDLVAAAKRIVEKPLPIEDALQKPDGR